MTGRPPLYELHCHAFGSVPAAMALERLAAVGPDMADFARRHHEAYGAVPDLRAVIEGHRRGEPDALDRFAAIYQLTDDGGDRFARFQAKYNILTATSAFRRQPRKGPLLPSVIDELSWLTDGLVGHWTAQGLGHVELRFMLPAVLSQGQARQCLLHLLDRCRRHTGPSFRLDLVLSVPRGRPDRHWSAVERILREHERGQHLVGIDLCHRESAASLRDLRAFGARLHDHNRAHPGRTLALLIHVGEQIRRRAFEAHIRHVADALELGAHRLGHALIAGIDIPAQGRQLRRETRDQRLDQLAWEEEKELTDPAAMAGERARLLALPAGAGVDIVYDDTRLGRCAEQQRWLLGRLREAGAIIECCPTSNRLMLGLDDDRRHPIHRLHAAGLDLAIGSDDPGITDSPLPAEWAWVGRQLPAADLSAWQARHADWTARRLAAAR